MIKFIIFDVGGILFQDGPPRFALELSRDVVGKFSEEGEKEYFRLRPLLQTGRMKSRDLFSHLVKTFALQKSANIIYSEWLALYKEIAILNKEIVDLLESLKKNYSVVGFSNTIDIHGDYNKYIGNYSIFNTLFLSYEIGYRKPDKKAYEYVLHSLGAKPEECIFVDDRKENIAAAENLGIKSVKFDNNKQLKDSLKKLGIV